MKKILSILLAAILFFTYSVYVFAAGENTSDVNINIIDNTKLVQTITDKNELQKIIERDHLTVAPNSQLEKVEIFVYKPANNESITNSNMDIQPMAGLIYEIRNVVVSPKEFYYVNDYTSDWYDGPCVINHTYTEEKEVEYNINTTIGNSTVSAAIGYALNEKFTVSKSFSTTVASGKRLNVRVHVNYKSTEFDIYNKFTGKLVESKAWAAKPIGLVIFQYTYSK